MNADLDKGEQKKKKRQSYPQIHTAQHSRNQSKERKNFGSRMSRIAQGARRITRMRSFFLIIPAKAGIHLRITSYTDMFMKITTEIKENAME
jgi:hypothetical protein